jgi:hypothetical protein
MIPRLGSWRINADLIADVAKLGYLEGSVVDLTYGRGGFWRTYTPSSLWMCDIDPERSPIGFSVDCRHTSFGDGQFNVAVLDLPYRMGGRSDRGDFDDRYGTNVYEPWQGIYRKIFDGMKECARIAKDRMLVKCMDAVVSGEVHWQTRDFTDYAETLGFYLEDRFDMLVHCRPQPTQKRTRSNYSTLLVLRRGRSYRQRSSYLEMVYGSRNSSSPDPGPAEDIGSSSSTVGGRGTTEENN